MGVTMEYLKGVCDCVFGSLESRIKLEVIILLSKQIDSYDNNSYAGNHIMFVICSSNTAIMTDDRVEILKTMKILDSTYTFMLPKKLGDLTSRFDYMREGEIMVSIPPDATDIVRV